MQDDVTPVTRKRYRLIKISKKRKKRASTFGVLIRTSVTLAVMATLVAAALSALYPDFPAWVDSRLTAAAAILGKTEKIEIFQKTSNFVLGIPETVSAFFSNLPASFFGDGAEGGTGGLFCGKVPKGMTAPEGTLLSPVLFSSGALFPVEKGKISCEYAYRYHPLSGELDFHTGVDIAAEQGNMIRAAWPGRVSEHGSSPVYGNYIKLEHGAGVTTVYSHCSELLAPVGSVVRQGEGIALVGSTGISTGPHVHFDVLVNGIYVNPRYCLS